MNIEHLIHMANQIGSYFAAEPDPADARAGIADHIARFWEKRMRQSLYAGLDSGEASALAPLVSEALAEHRERLLGRAA
ncbi:formate dehydrogenase subunit delta [Betaproteobacteria bacterium SCN1]|jgi:formate dehydrogenase subunit delta|nr:formate dehydrogenase subunit delta [Betaproteobacteria bacterium SCN1]MBN8761115.1 formate dehydrogenase subunit delta [Thiobacillus sp.]ODU87521.1 MAG: formate dehydrogenase [Thiobacillus sp. SCN 65-179]OJW38730.1 MAG: formate dehydrogenase [Thiobacillus sp. 65-69]